MSHSNTGRAKDCNNLTEFEFWDKYWGAKKSIGQTVVPRRYLFGDVLSKLFIVDSNARFLEIGGFPGFYSIWFSKYLGYQCSLLDIYIKTEIVDSLVRINGAKPITTIQGDVFSFEPNEKFDVVMSAGLVEHFLDLSDIIQRHWVCLRDGGTLIVCVPNFLGLNGLVQRIFDKKNFAAHNAEAMDLQKMSGIIGDAGFKDVRASYYGGFGVWIEESKFESGLLKLAVKVLNYVRIPFNVLGLNIKLFSPYIIYTATK